MLTEGVELQPRSSFTLPYVDVSDQHDAPVAAPSGNNPTTR